MKCIFCICLCIPAGAHMLRLLPLLPLLWNVWPLLCICTFVVTGIKRFSFSLSLSLSKISPVNTGTGNGLVLSGNKTLPEPMMTHINDDPYPCHRIVPRGLNELNVFTKWWYISMSLVTTTCTLSRCCSLCNRHRAHKPTWASAPFAPVLYLCAVLSTGLFLDLRPTNERWCYFVVASLIGWVQA